MVRCARAASFLIARLASTAKGGVDAHEVAPGIDEARGGAWSYLDVAIPTPLSDMSVQILPAATATSTTTTTADGSGTGGGATTTTTTTTTTEEGDRIVITGGCDSPNGNELVAADWGEVFACSSVTSKVSWSRVRF